MAGLLELLGETLFGSPPPSDIQANDDVRNAIARSVRAAAERVSSAYRSAYPDDAAGATQLEQLASLDLDAPMAVGAHIEQVLAGASDRVRTFARDRFAALFIFAFREIGLKANENVRAVLFEAFFERLDRSERNLRDLIFERDDELRARLQTLGYRMNTMQSELAKLFDELRGEVHKILFDHRLLGDGPIVAYVRVEDERGNALFTESVRSRKFKIGRGGGSDVAIRLLDGKVSRQHAEIVLEDGAAIVRDLESKHGTFIDGEQVRGTTRIDFGTLILIGPFRLRVLGPDAGAAQLFTPSTT